MTKFVIESAELIKRTYMVDADTKEEAIEQMKDKYPQSTEVLSNSIFNVRTINEYEYKRKMSTTTWTPKQRDLCEESNDIWRDD